MLRAATLAMLGAAPLAWTGGAWAQDATLETLSTPQSVLAEEQPWYERFTYGSDDVTASGLPNDAQVFDFTLDWAANDRWSVSLDLRNRFNGVSVPRDEFEVGAFYQITPRLRLGGALSLGRPEADVAVPVAPGDELDAGVKFETGFKF